MSHLYTKDKRFLCNYFRKGYSDMLKFGPSGLSENMPLSYYDGVSLADYEIHESRDEYMEDHSNA